MVKLFGFEINRKQKEEEKEKLNTFVSDTEPDGSVSLAAGSALGGFYDLDGTIKSESDLVTRYRQMALTAEVEFAVDEITNEAIVQDGKDVVKLNLDKLEVSTGLKNKIHSEFEYIKNLLDLNDNCYEYFRRWFIDGRMYYHNIIDETAPEEGIKELRYIDPRTIRKVKEYDRERMSNTYYKKVLRNEYFVYSENGFGSNMKKNTGMVDTTVAGLKIAKDSIIYVPSGLMNESNTMVLSHLHKTIKPLNQLKALEDAVVIYRIARAPEKRIFYIDVGNLPKAKAEQYLREIMANYKNKLTYDVGTGNIREDRRHQAMLEDYWLPRREGGRGTEITTLPGGQQLGQIEDLEYFQRKLFQALMVPMSRLDDQAGFSFSRATEIQRDELKFYKFVLRLRKKFSVLFLELLKKQLLLKQIINEEDWEVLRSDIIFEYGEDNHFSEMKEMDILSTRLDTLDKLQDKVGTYYSKSWVRRNILQQTEKEIAEIDSEIQDEISNNEILDPMMQDQDTEQPPEEGIQ